MSLLLFFSAAPAAADHNFAPAGIATSEALGSQTFSLGTVHSFAPSGIPTSAVLGNEKFYNGPVPPPVGNSGGNIINLTGFLPTSSNGTVY